MSERVRLIEQRRTTRPEPSRSIMRAAGGRGGHRSWRLLDDGRGWLADVEYVVAYDWG